MAIAGRCEPVKRVCQLRDTPPKAKNKAVTVLPASWKLTPQQKAFIDAFAEDDIKKTINIPARSMWGINPLFIDVLFCTL